MMTFQTMKHKLRLLWLISLLAISALCCACERVSFADDFETAREAVAQRNWPSAERLLERFLREEQNLDKRWEAWQLLLTVINSTGVEARASLEYLEAMLEEFADNDARTKVILERMGQINEALRRYERAADVWSAYTGLGDLTPEETVDGYRRLAAVQFSLRRFESGEDALQQCLALPMSDQEKLLCMYDLADHNMARERREETADLCRQILDSQPEKELRGLAAYLLADALEQLGRAAEALKQFESARDDYPNPSVIDNRIAFLRKKQKK